MTTSRLLTLRKRCTTRGILLPKKISKGGIIGLLKCETLLIGIEPERAGLGSKARVISTKTVSENLKWTSLTIKKGIPTGTFSRIYIGNPDLLLTEDNDVSPRPYHAISRVLKKDGFIYLVPGGSYLCSLMERLGRDFKFIEFCSPSNVTFAVYVRHGESEGPLREEIAHVKSPGKYQLVDLNLEGSKDPKRPLHITLAEFIEEVGRTEFMNQFASSVRHLLAHKKEFYLKKKGEVKKKFDVLQRKVKNIKSIGVDFNTVKEMYPMYEFYVGFLFELGEMASHITRLQKKVTPANIKRNLLEAIYDSNRGLESLVGRHEIKNELVSRLYAFSQNWKVFVGNFCNFALMGPSGVGKTILGHVISFVFSKSGILATDHIHVVTRSDLVGQYIGQTAPRTRSLLLASLEGVLFIDEAYQLAGCDRDFGREAITEMVNFLDKYVGMSVVIVAGYQGLMKEKFFPSNEGLERRFPHQIVLEPYSVSQLTDILVNFVGRSLPFDLTGSTKNLLFTMISQVHQDLPKAFDKQAGDMLNLGGGILTSIYSSYKIRWGTSKGNSQILTSAFTKFLRTKGHLGYTFR